MSLSINVEKIQWNQAQHFRDFHGFAAINAHVPREITGFAESVEGKLIVSPGGYVFSDIPKHTLWIKFLCLANYLTAASTLSKCRQAAASLFSGPVTPKEEAHAQHLSRLASIARNAVVYQGGHPLYKRVEEFALAEILHNSCGRSIREEIDRPRSDRLKENYQAKCLQPLFHIDQTDGRNWELAKRCDKYAAMALLQQQGCLTQAIKNLAVETEEEVECCHIMCYKRQKICGILYKIEMCGFRFWAVG